MTTPNPSVPDPNVYPASSPQQPSYQYQGGVSPQGMPQLGMQQNWAAQPGNGAPAQAYAQPGYTGYGYAPAAPVKRRTPVSYTHLRAHETSSRATMETAETACTGSRSG